MAHYQFMQKVMECIESGDRVLDLGAGDGRNATRIADAGAGLVIAVDRTATSSERRNIVWIRSDIEHYLDALDPVESFSAVLLINVLQFMDRTSTIACLLPTIQRHIAAGGLIAIRTFSRNPSPPFSLPCRTFYSLEELQHEFKGWNIVLAAEQDFYGSDLKNTRRHFWVVDLIARKPDMA